MIVSKGRSYIFVHIPKTGGTSLAQALEERAMRDDILIGDTPKAKRRQRRLKSLQVRGRLWKHSTLTDIDGLLTAEEIAALFTFTLVRNPWDRVVSYYHWLRVQAFDHPVVGLAKRLPFKDFLRDPAVRAAFVATPARSYMTDAQGFEKCRSYIRLEHFTTDAEPLCDHLGFDLLLPHLNRSDRAADYRSYYDDESRRIVAEDFEEDISRFGYNFDS